MAPTNAHPPIKSPRIRPAHDQKKSSRARNGTITPIIKIVHMYAPTLVETDVANFRELVQRMTGNDGHIGAGHNDRVKATKTQSCCMQLVPTSDETINKDMALLAMATSSRASKACTRREGMGSSEITSLGTQGATVSMVRGTCVNGEEEEGLCEFGDMESSCEQSVNSFFAESEVEVSLEDQLCKMQQTYCGAFLAATSAWRPPLQEIPGGFESFDCF